MAAMGKPGSWRLGARALASTCGDSPRLEESHGLRNAELFRCVCVLLKGLLVERLPRPRRQVLCCRRRLCAPDSFSLA